ncbi:uncharacterized protein RBU57_015733 isoform 1-T1 [Macrochelys suwanniensis]
MGNIHFQLVENLEATLFNLPMFFIIAKEVDLSRGDLNDNHLDQEMKKIQIQKKLLRPSGCFPAFPFNSGVPRNLKQILLHPDWSGRTLHPDVLANILKSSWRFFSKRVIMQNVTKHQYGAL